MSIVSIMAERDFRANSLTPVEWNRVEDARRTAERTLETTLTNKELLMLLVNEVGPRWKPGRGA